MKQARFHVYQAKDGWRWHLKAANGRVLAQGEAHTRKADAERAARVVIQTVEHIGHKAMIDRIRGTHAKMKDLTLIRYA